MKVWLEWDPGHFFVGFYRQFGDLLTEEAYYVTLCICIIPTLPLFIEWKEHDH